MKGSNQFATDTGTYLLLLELADTQKIKPGSLEEAEYKKGMYIYVGRARKGLKARLQRHIRKEKKQFWHIDHLLRKAKLREIWTRENYFDECQIASRIRDLLRSPSPTHPRFGASDCRCPGHLVPISSSKKEVRLLLQNNGFLKVKFNGNAL